MMDIVAQDRNRKLEEYLELLRLLAFELERAMRAIAQNSLPALEDSVANQQAFSTRLGEVAQDLSKPCIERGAFGRTLPDDKLMDEIQVASRTLNNLNQRYATLLNLSSHSVAQMVSLFRSFQGQLKEDSGPRLKLHTWSCRG